MSTLELYERLKPKLGEIEARALLEHIEQLRKGSVAQTEFQEKLSELVTKGMLKAELAELKASLMRWTFALWATQMLAIIALFLRK